MIRKSAIHWQPLIIVIVFSLAAVLVVFGRADFPRAQKTDPSKLTGCQKRILGGTVRIAGTLPDGATIGSGVVVGYMKENGTTRTVILTANHVMDISRPVVSSYDIGNNKLGETSDVRIIKRDPAKDLALITIPYDPNLPVIKIDQEVPKKGERVDVYGCLGIEGALPCLRGREGIFYYISDIVTYGVDREGRIVKFTGPMTALPPEIISTFLVYEIKPGSNDPNVPIDRISPTGGTSGGPVTTINGAIIGICSTQPQGLIVACSGLEEIKKFLNNLPISLAPPTSPEEEYLNELKKMLEDAIKNAGAPMAPKLTPIP